MQLAWLAEMRQMPARGAAPPSLAAGAKAATDQILKAVQAKRKVSYSSLYASSDVREALNKLQAGVCVYCEATIAPVCIGHIEHFRPKGQVKNEDTGHLMRPGYYWLAYEWSNLMLACERCNVEVKGSRFPVVNEGARVRSPAPLDVEEAVLIDPFYENPRHFIRFKESVARGVDEAGRGARVRDILRLNDPELERARRSHLLQIRAMRFLMLHDDNPQKRAEAEALYLEWMSPTATFSSCVSDNAADL